MIQAFRPWTHTSDDSYIYQLSLVVATATVSFSSSDLAHRAPIICTYENCCLLLYLDMTTYEYWCCWYWWCCCTSRVVSYDPSLVVTSFASHSRSCCCAE